MSRLRSNNVFGTTTDAPLTAGATTLNGAGLANLAAVASPDYAVITLDPNRVNGAPEIIYVTAHTGSATSATILRGREGTSAREHPAGTFWVHAATALDLALGELGYAQVTADQASISSLVDLTNLSVTVTVGAERRVRITAQARINNDGTAGTVLGYIRESSTVLNLFAVNSVIASGFTLAHGSHILTPSAGSHTYKLSAEKAGSGSFTLDADATYPAFILVEDIGPQRTTQPS